jgi:hypothetical protein
VWENELLQYLHKYAGNDIGEQSGQGMPYPDKTKQEAENNTAYSIPDKGVILHEEIQEAVVMPVDKEKDLFLSIMQVNEQTDEQV